MDQVYGCNYRCGCTLPIHLMSAMVARRAGHDMLLLDCPARAGVPFTTYLSPPGDAQAARHTEV